MVEVCWLNINFLLKINRTKWSLQANGHQGSYFSDACIAQRSGCEGWAAEFLQDAGSMWLLGGTGGPSPHPQRDPGFHYCCVTPSSCPETGGEDKTLMISWWNPQCPPTRDPAFSGHCLQSLPTCPFPTCQNEFPSPMCPFPTSQNEFPLPTRTLQISGVYVSLTFSPY